VVAAVLFSADFFAVDFLAVDFFFAGFLATGFLAADFFPVVLFAGAFLLARFLAVDFFFAAGFFAGRRPSAWSWPSTSRRTNAVNCSVPRLPATSASSIAALALSRCTCPRSTMSSITAFGVLAIRACPLVSGARPGRRKAVRMLRRRLQETGVQQCR